MVPLVEWLREAKPRARTTLSRTRGFLASVLSGCTRAFGRVRGWLPAMPSFPRLHLAPLIPVRVARSLSSWTLRRRGTAFIAACVTLAFGVYGGAFFGVRPAQFVILRGRLLRERRFWHLRPPQARETLFRLTTHS